MEEVLIYIVGLLVIWIGWLITYYGLFHCLTLQLFGMTEKNNTVELSYNDIKFMCLCDTLHVASDILWYDYPWLERQSFLMAHIIQSLS